MVSFGGAGAALSDRAADTTSVTSARNVTSGETTATRDRPPRSTRLPNAMDVMDGAVDERPGRVCGATVVGHARVRRGTSRRGTSRAGVLSLGRLDARV